jgi:hypothetical protein
MGVTAVSYRLVPALTPKEAVNDLNIIVKEYEQN